MQQDIFQAVLLTFDTLKSEKDDFQLPRKKRKFVEKVLVGDKMVHFFLRFLKTINLASIPTESQLPEPETNETIGLQSWKLRPGSEINLNIKPEQPSKTESAITRSMKSYGDMQKITSKHLFYETFFIGGKNSCAVDSL